MSEIPAIVLTNGRRSCLARTLPSIREHLAGVGDLVIVDDSGDRAYRSWLTSEYPDAVVTVVAPEPAGYWRSMKTVWAIARDSGADALAFWEDDFVLTEDVDLTDLQRVLDAHPYLTQAALLRQPWFANEREHGGLIEGLEAQGQVFEERTDGRGRWWIEHRACFTGNPSLIPASTFAHDWPEGAWSESRFGQLLFTDPAARGAYWGRRSDPPRVEHIGHQRVGRNY